MNPPFFQRLSSLNWNPFNPQGPIRLFLRRLGWFAAFLAILYACLHFFPQTLFPYSVTSGDITIYSRSPLPPDATACADRAAGLLRQSELAIPGRQEHIFVCNSPWFFGLFCPTSTRAFAVSVPLTDHIFVSSADISQDIVRRSGEEFNQRSLSSVMAHEITHGLIRKKLGLFQGSRLPDWVAEGYCDFVARESSFPEKEGLQLFESGQDHPSMAYRYFVYRQMVRYLIEGEKLTFLEVVSRGNEPETVRAQARIALR